MINDAITVTPTIYTVTIVCPLCHQPMSFKENSDNACPNCGTHFIVKPVIVSQAPQWVGGPSEVKDV